MKREYSSNDEALKVAKRAVYLAWLACGGASPFGMAILQARAGEQTEEQVWESAYHRHDYGGMGFSADRINCDYVQGRMMKLCFYIDGNVIEHVDSTPSLDYQGWCGTYPTYAAVFEAAEQSLRAAVQEAA